MPLPGDIRPGDLLAVPVAGAYHLSMASGYNLVGRPPVVAVHEARPVCWCAVRRRKTSGGAISAPDHEHPQGPCAAASRCGAGGLPCHSDSWASTATGYDLGPAFVRAQRRVLAPCTQWSSRGGEHFAVSAQAFSELLKLNA